MPFKNHYIQHFEYPLTEHKLITQCLCLLSSWWTRYSTQMQSWPEHWLHVSALSVKFTTYNLPQQKAGLVNDAIVSSQLTLVNAKRPEKTLLNLICNGLKSYQDNLVNQIISDDSFIHWSGARNAFSYAMLSSLPESNNDSNSGMPKSDLLVSHIHKRSIHFQCINTDIDWRNASLQVESEYQIICERWLITCVNPWVSQRRRNCITQGKTQSSSGLGLALLSTIAYRWQRVEV